MGALWECTWPLDFDDSISVLATFGQFPGLFGKGGIPKVVPPLYEEGPPRRRRRSGFGSNLEIWPHAKIEDSYIVWTHFDLLDRCLFDLLGLCISHGLPGWSKGTKKAPPQSAKTYLKGNRRVA